MHVKFGPVPDMKIARPRRSAKRLIVYHRLFRAIVISNNAGMYLTSGHHNRFMVLQIRNISLELMC